LVSILITLYFINAKNESLLNVLNEANKEIVLLKSNNISLKASLNEQNKKIESNRLDYEQKLKQYEDWKKQPVEVKYQYITKEVKSNECEDIKKSIDNSIDRLNAYRLHNKN
jgi:hypothetical protein